MFRGLECPTNSALIQLFRQPAVSPEFNQYTVKNQNSATHTVKIRIAADIQPHKVFSGYRQDRPFNSVKDLENNTVVSLLKISLKFNKLKYCKLKLCDYSFYDEGIFKCQPLLL